MTSTQIRGGGCPLTKLLAPLPSLGINICAFEDGLSEAKTPEVRTKRDRPGTRGNVNSIDCYVRRFCFWLACHQPAPRMRSRPMKHSTMIVCIAIGIAYWLSGALAEESRGVLDAAKEKGRSQSRYLKETKPATRLLSQSPRLTSLATGNWWNRSWEGVAWRAMAPRWPRVDSGSTA